MPVHVTIGLVQRFLLVNGTLARNSNNHSSKNIRATVITKLNFTQYIYVDEISKPAKFHRNRM